MIVSVLGLSAPVQAGARDQAVGSYTKGKLKNASQLKQSGPGYVLLFPHRDRAYGTDDLIETVETVAEDLAARFPEGERLQVGDTSARQGGFISGHASHQNGLDVDFGYFRMNHQEQEFNWSTLFPDFTALGFDEEFVIGGKLSSNFDLQRNWELFKALVSTTKINRIFVDQVIKASLCTYSRSIDDFSVETLRHLRPWPKHGDHIHVRLLCPASSTNCAQQEPVAAGSGCDELGIE
ncbi:MAG: hypothetical protein A2Z97_10755 [Bdellovibrionales bacterium GWB1_52_6]|nr:MAG: hypothetical protein A2Z97_10755 [Bdellovibrionales bacterium GWB1_52_6]OFZ03373.1 MAG: hypothetical protein A2X97_05360 [Bdellovibrionales bacterium GWA1_52_35]